MAKKMEVIFKGTLIVPDDTNINNGWDIIREYLRRIGQDSFLEPVSYELAPHPMKNLDNPVICDTISVGA